MFVEHFRRFDRYRTTACLNKKRKRCRSGPRKDWGRIWAAAKRQSNLQVLSDAKAS